MYPVYSDSNLINISGFGAPHVAPAEVTTAVTKEAELLLRRAEVSWGPCLQVDSTPYGFHFEYCAQSPDIRVHIDCVPEANYVGATLSAPNRPLFTRFAALLLEPIDPCGYPDIRFTTGSSHPDFGYLVDAFAADLLRFSRLAAFLDHDGSTTDEPT